MHAITDLMERDLFAKHLGIALVEVRPGYAKATMQIRREHLNGFGMMHGGAIFALADFAFAAAVNSHGTLAVAINVSISYLRPPAGATLHAEASEIHRSRTLASCTVRVTDDEQHLVGIFQGVAYRKAEPIPTACPEDSAPPKPDA